MVYEIECAECGDMIDFGSGDEPEEAPEGSIKWNGDFYCRDCVEEFVRLGVGDVRSRIAYLEDRMEEAAQSLGLEFEYSDEK